MGRQVGSGETGKGVGRLATGWGDGQGGGEIGSRVGRQAVGWGDWPWGGETGSGVGRVPLCHYHRQLVTCIAGQ